MRTGMKTIVGLFDNLSEARSAVDELQREGFGRNDINLLAQASSVEYALYFDSAGRYQDVEPPAPEPPDAAHGAGVGATLGALAGLLLGLSIFAVPGLGAIVAAGPIASSLLGAAAGGITGGLIATLFEAGIPEDHAEIYNEGVRRGGTLVLLKTPSAKMVAATDILNRHNPVDVQERAQSWKLEGWQQNENELARAAK